MKIRIGISLGDGALDAASPDSVLDFIDDCGRWDIDSVWVSDRIAAPRSTLDAVVFMAYLASRMRNMKFGTAPWCCRRAIPLSSPSSSRRSQP